MTNNFENLPPNQNRIKKARMPLACVRARLVSNSKKIIEQFEFHEVQTELFGEELDQQCVNNRDWKTLA